MNRCELVCFCRVCLSKYSIIVLLVAAAFATVWMTVASTGTQASAWISPGITMEHLDDAHRGRALSVACADTATGVDCTVSLTAEVRERVRYRNTNTSGGNCHFNPQIQATARPTGHSLTTPWGATKCLTYRHTWLARTAWQEVEQVRPIDITAHYRDLEGSGRWAGHWMNAVDHRAGPNTGEVVSFPFATHTQYLRLAYPPNERPVRVCASTYPTQSDPMADVASPVCKNL